MSECVVFIVLGMIDPYTTKPLEQVFGFLAGFVELVQIPKLSKLKDLDSTVL